MGTSVIAAVDPDQARDQARDIVGQRRFRNADVPRPFKGILEWLGERLQPITDWFGWVGDLMDNAVGRYVITMVLAALGVLLVMLIVRARRRAGVASSSTSERSRAERDLDPAALEREADAAERAGDFETALRLRFLAGLVRLSHAGVISYQPSITSGEVARRLRVAPYDVLAQTHDEIVYGGRRPVARDLDESRSNWPEVLRAVRS